MTNAQSERVAFSEDIQRCARALHDAYDGAPLRDLQAASRSLLFNGSGPRLRTVAFIMDQWVRDYYRNFAGDVISTSWEPIEQIRKEILTHKAADALDKLAVAVAEGGQPSEALEELITSYLDGVEAANRAFDETR